MAQDGCWSRDKDIIFWWSCLTNERYRPDNKFRSLPTRCLDSRKLMPESWSNNDVSASSWHPTSSGHTRMSYMSTRTECNRGRAFRTRKSVQCTDADWTSGWSITIVMDWIFINTEGQPYKASKLSMKLTWTSDRSQSNKCNSSMRSAHNREDWGRIGVVTLRIKCIVRRQDRLRMLSDGDQSDTWTWVMHASDTDNWRKSLKAHGSVYHRWDRPSPSLR